MFRDRDDLKASDRFIGDQLYGAIEGGVQSGKYSEASVQRLTRLLLAAGYGPQNLIDQVTLPTPVEIAAGDFRLKERALYIPDGRILDNLSSTHYEILATLMRRSPSPVATEVIGRAVGIQTHTSNAVAVHINYLRNRIETSKPPKYLLTVRGFGYRFQP